MSCGRARRLVRPHGLGGGGGDVRAAPARPSRGPRRSRDAQPRLRGGKWQQSGERHDASCWRREQRARRGGRGGRAFEGAVPATAAPPPSSRARPPEEFLPGSPRRKPLEALVESRVPFAGERRFVGARRPGGVAVHLVDRDPAEVLARERCHRPRKKDPSVARRPSKMRRISSLLPPSLRARRDGGRSPPRYAVGHPQSAGGARAGAVCLFPSVPNFLNFRSRCAFVLPNTEYSQTL